MKRKQGPKTLPRRSGSTSTNGYQEGFERRLRKELCEDLARRHAKASAMPEDTSAVRLNYRSIAHELRTLVPVTQFPSPEYFRDWNERSSAAIRRKDRKTQAALIAEWWEALEKADAQPTLARRMKPHFTNAKARTAFFKELDREIRGWLLSHLKREELPAWEIAGVQPFSPEIMRTFALEWLRDPGALRAFLNKSLQRWGKLDAPRSSARVATVTLQIAPFFRTANGHDITGIQDHLQRVQALRVPTGKATEKEHSAQQNLIRQILSREAKTPRATTRKDG